MNMQSYVKYVSRFIFVFCGLIIGAANASAQTLLGSWDLNGSGTLQNVYSYPVRPGTTEIRVVNQNSSSSSYFITVEGVGASWALMGAEDLDGQPGAELMFSFTYRTNSVGIKVITHRRQRTEDVFPVNGEGTWALMRIADVDGKPGKELLLNTWVVSADYRVVHFSAGFAETRNYPLGRLGISPILLTPGLADTDGAAGEEMIVNLDGKTVRIISDAAATTHDYLIGSDAWTVFGVSDLDGAAGNEIVIKHGDYLEIINDKTRNVKRIFVGGTFTFNRFQNVDGKGGNEIVINKNSAQQVITYFVPADGGGSTATEFLLQHVGGSCIHPLGGATVPGNGTPAVLFPSCVREPRITFRFYANGYKSLEHVSSGKCLHPEGGSENPAVGTRLVLWNACTESVLKNINGNKKLAFEITAAGSIRHINSGLCVHPSGGSANPAAGTELVLWNSCDEPRLKFTKL